MGFFSAMLMGQWSSSGLIVQIIQAFLALSFAAELWRIIFIYWRMAPSMHIVGFPTLLGRRLTAFRWLIDPLSLLSQGYDQCHGRPFAVPLLDRYFVLVTKKAHAEELSRAPASVLSSHDSTREATYAAQTMDGLDTLTDPNGGTARALTQKFRSDLPSIAPKLATRAEDAISLEFGADESLPHSQGSREVILSFACGRAMARVNTLFLLGAEDSNQPKLTRLWFDYLTDCKVAFTLLQVTPAPLIDLVGALVMRYRNSVGKLINLIHTFVIRRCDNLLSNEGSKQLDPCYLQWILDISRVEDRWKLAKQILPLAFAGEFQMPTIFHHTIVQLCKHSEYLDPLREEADSLLSKGGESLASLELPLLDSFIKETLRLNPATWVSGVRRVNEDFTFADGTMVPAGNWIGMPQYQIMRSDACWEDATTFRGFRFVSEQSKSRSTSKGLADPNWTFPAWGLSKHACPGRFYASYALKLLVAKLIVAYDFELKDSSMQEVFTFGAARVPNPSMAILVEPRKA